MLDADGEVRAIAAFATQSRKISQFDDLLTFIQSPKDARKNLRFAVRLNDIDLKSWGGLSSDPLSSSFRPTFAAATTDDAFTPIPKAPFGMDGDHVYVACDQAQIPNGLCWIWLVQPNSEKVSLHLPQLELVKGRWRFRKMLLDLLGLKPNEPVDFKYLQVADGDNFDAFNTDEVYQFVQNLPVDSLQRKLAAEYLGLNSEED
jgi:hypothetical protein